VRVITLTTDFGAADWFVGSMKGVILALNPRVQIVDITHGVPAGNLRAAAFALTASCRFFPKHSVHVAVVDPGVGGHRAALAIQTEDYFFVGPDNGVLSVALAREKIRAVFQITNEQLFLKPLSHTFHGRDMFAPVAAHLSKGLPIQNLGPSKKDFVKLDWPQPHRSANSVTGEIVYIDGFGNAITNISHEPLARPAESSGALFAKRRRLCSIKPSYQAVPRQKAVAVPGSSGFLEIAVNGGSAAAKLGLKIGDAVTFRPKAP